MPILAARFIYDDIQGIQFHAAMIPPEALAA
jgi:hypothetical protein